MVYSLSAGCVGVTSTFPSTFCHPWGPVCAMLRDPGGRGLPHPPRRAPPVPAAPFPYMGSPLAASGPPHSLSPPQRDTGTRSPSLKLIRAVRTHLSRCHQGHESDWILEGRRGDNTDPPDLGAALIWGVQGEGLGADDPLHGLGNCTAPPYTGDLISAISLVPRPGTLDLQRQWDGEHSPKVGAVRGKSLSPHQSPWAPVDPWACS